MKLIKQDQYDKLVANNTQSLQAREREESFDPLPVVKLFTPWTGATWLITELDPETNIAFGLCDLGMGCPELGYVSIDELQSIVGPAGLKIERDRGFNAIRSLSWYADRAFERGRIVRA